MPRYEMVRKIENECRRNQMRDVFVEEIEAPSPLEYVRSFVKGEGVKFTETPDSHGGVTITSEAEGLYQEFKFSPID